jgi:hypothetical protein
LQETKDLNDSNIEALLIQLVEQNATIADRLADVIDELKELREEFNWVREHSFGKVLVDHLASIEGELQRLG